MNHSTIPQTFGQLLDAYFQQYLQALEALRQEIHHQQPVPQPTPAPEDKLLTATEAGQLLGVTRQTIFDYAKRGMLLPHRLAGRTFFKHHEVIQALRAPEPVTGRRRNPRK